ncbi:hypothetical protein GQ53DRAFT_751327 [Thozetella sp. PMI_491]|nr:hypothetical protein GQ53DRAFT_751327 [Thozetella sp. PMI_491]
MPVVTVTDYSDDAPAASRWSRSCPSMVPWWHFSWEAFSLSSAPDGASRLRRIAMWTVLVSTLLLGVFDWGRLVLDLNIVMVILKPIIVLINLLFIGFCLAQIGQAEGTRTVLGLDVTRRHFDIVLYVAAFCYVGMVTGYYLFFIPHLLISSWRLFWWLLIAASGWVASWPSDGGISLA